MSRLSDLGHDLYTGRVSINFVGRRLLWYAISFVLLVICASGLLVKGLNFGIEFEGGVEYQVSVPSQQDRDALVAQIREDVATGAEQAGIPEASSPIVNTSGDNNIRIQTEPLSSSESREIAGVIQESAGVDSDSISVNAIGATWGAQVADRALLGLAVFLVLVVLFIWAYFREWKMSVGALVALAHDVLITVGVYALSGFEVTPATVTGVLTILGFSLYDTVVVFDKVRENTKNLTRTHQTYAEAANLAVNQTLVRSINTSIVALLPVGALLWMSVASIGTGALKDLALSLFVGMAAGLYSSVFIATPLVVQLKEREAGVRAGDARARKHRARKQVDRYADVPTFTEDMAIQDEPEAAAEDDPALDDDREPEESGVGARPSRTPRSTAGERPAPAARPAAPSAAAKRAQPSRKPRSRRGKR